MCAAPTIIRNCEKWPQRTPKSCASEQITIGCYHKNSYPFVCEVVRGLFYTEQLKIHQSRAHQAWHHEEAIVYAITAPIVVLLIFIVWKGNTLWSLPKRRYGCVWVESQPTFSVCIVLAAIFPSRSLTCRFALCPASDKPFWPQYVTEFWLTKQARCHHS